MSHHNEPPGQDLHCLQIQLFLSLVLKEFIKKNTLNLGYRTEVFPFQKNSNSLDPSLKMHVKLKLV